MDESIQEGRGCRHGSEKWYAVRLWYLLLHEGKIEITIGWMSGDVY